MLDPADRTSVSLSSDGRSNVRLPPLRFTLTNTALSARSCDSLAVTRTLPAPATDTPSTFADCNCAIVISSVWPEATVMVLSVTPAVRPSAASVSLSAPTPLTNAAAPVVTSTKRTRPSTKLAKEISLPATVTSKATGAGSVELPPPPHAASGRISSVAESPLLDFAFSATFSAHFLRKVSRAFIVLGSLTSRPAPITAAISPVATKTPSITVPLLPAGKSSVRSAPSKAK